MLLTLLKIKFNKAPGTWPAELKQEWKVVVGFGDATPVLSGKKIYLNTRQGDQEVILCLDAATGKLLWQVATPVQQRFYNCVSPYIDGQTIYLTGQGTGMKAIKVEKSGNW